MSENCKIWEGNIGTIETREKICFRSSMFNKKDGKVQNYYYTLNQGTFVILLPNVIFFLIFPPKSQLERNQITVDRGENPSLSFFLFSFFLFTFFSRIILWKTNLLYFFFLFFLSSIFSYQPNAPFCFTNTFVLVFLFLFFTSCVFNDVKTKYLVYLLFPTFLLNTYNLL